MSAPAGVGRCASWINHYRPGATREQHFDDRTVVLVPQGTLVTVRHLGRSMTIKPRVDTVISRVR